MKSFLLVAVAFVLTTTAALAQTVAPGTTPGAQTGNPSNMPSAGTPIDQNSMSGRTDKMSTTDRSNKKMMRKSSKMKSGDGTMKTKTTM